MKNQVKTGYSKLKKVKKAKFCNDYANFDQDKSFV